MRDCQLRAPTRTMRSWVRACLDDLLLGGRVGPSATMICSAVATMAVTIRLERTRRSSADQRLGAGQPGQVGGELALAELDLVPDGLAHRGRTGGALAGDEEEVRALLVHVLDAASRPSGRRCR